MAPPKYYNGGSFRGRGRGGSGGNKRRREESPPAAPGVAAGPMLPADQTCAKNIIFAEEAECCVFDPNGICTLCERDGERCDVLEPWLWNDVTKLRKIMERIRNKGNGFNLETDDIRAQMYLRARADEAHSGKLYHDEIEEDHQKYSISEQLRALLLAESRKTNAHLTNIESAQDTIGHVMTNFTTNVRSAWVIVDKSNKRLRLDVDRLESRLENMQQGLHTDVDRLGQRMEAGFDRLEASIDRLGDRLEAALGANGPRYSGGARQGRGRGGYY